MNSILQSTEDVQRLTAQSIKFALEQVDVIIDTPLYSNEFMTLCRDIENSIYISNRNMESMQIQLNQMRYSSKFIQSVFFISQKHQTYQWVGSSEYGRLSFPILKEFGWYETTRQYQGGILWSYQSEYLIGRKPQLVCSRVVRDTATLENLGMIIIFLDPKLISDQYDYVNKDYILTMPVLSSRNEIIIPDKNRQKQYAIASNEVDKILSQPENPAKRNYLFMTPIGDSGFELVTILNNEKIILDTLRFILIATVILAFIAGIIIDSAIKYSKKLTTPIDALINSMEKIKSGKFETIASNCRYNDINILTENFNSMVSHINTLLNEVYEAELKQKKYQLQVAQSQLKTLQAQINPHFIYNTLESINILAKKDHNFTISSLIISLSNLLRITLSKGSEMITVKQEINMVKEYLNIQSINYSGKFEFTILINKDIEQVKIVKMTLQPLVENCIFHGFSELATGGVIQITGYGENHDVVITVKNNGLILSDEDLSNINHQILQRDNSSSIERNGFGISNVNQRLKLYYGKEYGIQFSRSEKNETVVTVRFPKIYISK